MTSALSRVLSPRALIRLACWSLCLLSVLPAFAYVPEDGALEMQRPGVDVEPALERVVSMTPERARAARLALSDLGGTEDAARVDARSGRWAALWLAEPMIPGRGVGNSLSWADLGRAQRPDTESLTELVRERFHSYVLEHGVALGFDAAELRTNVGVHAGGDVVQIHSTREVGGLTVRGAVISATVNHGNLILLGAEKWADIDVSLDPTVGVDAARAAVAGHLGQLRAAGERAEPRLEIWPVAAEDAAASDGWEPTAGYRHLLVWVLAPELAGRHERLEAAVDAHTGEMVSVRDTNHYNRNVHGGVYPISNDGIGVDGMEQGGFPMPFADVTHPGGTDTTDSGGNLPAGVTGNITTALEGPYIRIDDQCGAVSESAADGDLDLGTSGGTDCTVPAGSSAGNTHAARTAFYELNRIHEMGRGQLPANGWLQSQLTAQTNLPNICNAFWTGSVVQFFQETGTCANLGELAGVLDHEWGHGMDDNGTAGSVSNPGEGIADIFSALRINSSCPGRGAFTSVCSGFGDPCIEAFGCTAARDIDWERHVSMTPHDVTWVNGNGSCGSSHCRGVIYAEAIWDLYKRDLPALYGFDNNTSLEITTRLTYLGADNVSTWYVTNNGGLGGCSATGGYQQFLGADDDNGNLADGTPHMQAIFDAFDRHEIACDTPTVQDSGCADRPATAPTVTASGVDLGVELSWAAVAGTARYKVFRTDGVHGCDLGKALVGETTGTSFEDTGLQNEREYYYVVAGFGASDSCMGPASDCVTGVSSDTNIFTDGFESGDTSAWSASVP